MLGNPPGLIHVRIRLADKAGKLVLGQKHLVPLGTTHLASGADSLDLSSGHLVVRCDLCVSAHDGNKESVEGRAVNKMCSVYFGSAVTWYIPLVRVTKWACFETVAKYLARRQKSSKFISVAADNWLGQGGPTTGPCPEVVLLNAGSKAVELWAMGSR